MEAVTQSSDGLAGLDGDLAFTFGAGEGGVDEEIKQMRVLSQLLQFKVQVVERRGLAAQVVNPEGLEIADDDEIRALRIGKSIRITLRLLERRDLSSLAQFRMIEIDVGALLLDERFGLRDQDVNKAAEARLLLKAGGGACVGKADDAAEQVNPEGLGFTFLVAVTTPPLDESGRSFAAS